MVILRILLTVFLTVLTIAVIVGLAILVSMIPEWIRALILLLAMGGVLIFFIGLIFWEVLGDYFN